MRMAFLLMCLLLVWSAPAIAQDGESRFRLGLKLAEASQARLDVTGLLFGHPAQLAGVEIGDVIMSVNSQRLQAPVFESLLGQLDGKKGLVLGVMRTGRPLHLRLGNPNPADSRPATAENTASAKPARRPRMAPPTRRPIKVENGRTLLWAKGRAQSDQAEWFDMTDSAVDPQTFQYGIGKDSIPSIDRPQFLKHDDPKLAGLGIDPETPVIAYQRNGVSKAYPVFIMDRHEIVNDDFGGEAWGVFW